VLRTLVCVVPRFERCVCVSEASVGVREVLGIRTQLCVIPQRETCVCISGVSLGFARIFWV